MSDKDELEPRERKVEEKSVGDDSPVEILKEITPKYINPLWRLPM